jgi:hypothetical protein
MTEPADSDARSTQRRARRDFIRAHHPDAGGNPDDFIAGLADLDAGRRVAPAARATPVTVVARSAWPVSLTTVMLRRIRRRYQPPRVR